jgi:parallel beta-helix repeat protein
MGNIISNNVNGIDLYHSGSNIIYHNNFANNSMQVNASAEVTNTWDNGYPNGGNYWDTYIGIDANGDHIGDTPYFIPGGDNLDRYPLMMPYKVILNQPPTCTLLASSTNGTVPLTVIFTMTVNASDGTITTWTLDIDNDGMPDYSGSGEPPSTQQHTYNSTGTYTAKFMVTDNHSSTASDSTIIAVSQVAPQNNAPIAEYTYSLQNPTTQDIIQFTDTSKDIDGEIINWTWNFGDGNHSYLQYPSHQYTTGGKYYVTLQVKDNDGLINITSNELIVTYHEYNQYIITVNIQPVTGGTVTLNPLYSMYNRGTLVRAIAVASVGFEFSYWSVNFNGIRTNPSIQIIMDSNKTLTAHFECSNVFPTANFQYSINELEVTFMDNSTETDGYITNWYWDFGDNNSSRLINPIHTYREGGSYTVSITITDDVGDTDTYSKIITVQLEKDKDDGISGFGMVLSIIALIILAIMLQKKR